MAQLAGSLVAATLVTGSQVVATLIATMLVAGRGGVSRGLTTNLACFLGTGDNLLRNLILAIKKIRLV